MPPAGTVPPVLFDPFDPAFIRDPYPAYERLQAQAPIWRSPRGSWVLSKYSDIAAVLKDARFGHDFRCEISDPRNRRPLLDEPMMRAVGMTMLTRDPPDHARLRGLVVRAFSATRVEAMRPRIERTVDALLDELVPLGRGDLMAQFARKLPVIVICDMLGIPEEDRPRFHNDFRISSRSFDPTPMTREEIDLANANTLRNEAYLEDLIQRRAASPGDDLLSALIETRDEDESRLSTRELTSNITLLFGAGHETTTGLIGNGLLALHRNRSEWERLQHTPSLAASATAELLRYDSSVQLTHRKAFEDVSLNGALIRRGEVVICLLGAANRDPDMYERPATLDITRPPSRPLSFGGGIHYCLGAQLARIESEVAFRRLVERMPNLELDHLNAPRWRQVFNLRGLAELHAHW